MDISELAEPPWDEERPWRILDRHEWRGEPPWQRGPPWGVENETQLETDDGGQLKATYVIEEVNDEVQPEYVREGKQEELAVGSFTVVGFWFESPDGDVFEFSGGKTRPNYAQDFRGWHRGKILRRGELWCEIWKQTCGTTMTDDEDLIPVNVSLLGKEGIAAFLYSVHGLTPPDIANTLEVTRDTARKYLSRFDRDSNTKPLIRPHYHHWI